MKNLLGLLLLFLSVNIYSQKKIFLDECSILDTLPHNEAIIYGNFIQRLGFRGSGSRQDIKLINNDTKQEFWMRVKPSAYTTKQNPFVCFIKPGNYTITEYHWGGSEFFHRIFFQVPVYKNMNVYDNTSQDNSDSLVQYKFSIPDNKVYYVGEWHFEKENIYFSEEKNKLDNRIQRKFPKLPFQNAEIVIPK